jgi:hypothetical protein
MSFSDEASLKTTLLKRRGLRKSKCLSNKTTATFNRERNGNRRLRKGGGKDREKGRRREREKDRERGFESVCVFVQE